MHFKIPKFQDGGLMHDLPPTLVSIFGRQLLGIPFGNPFASLNHMRPPIGGQGTECFS